MKAQCERRLVVLAIDDEPAELNLLAEALRACPGEFVLQTAVDGGDALDQLAVSLPPTLPDLILLDLKMPRLDGHAFLAEIKRYEALRAIPVVVLSTSALDRDVRLAYRQGAAGYLVKPADLDDFFAVIALLVHYWHDLVRLPERRE